MGDNYHDHQLLLAEAARLYEKYGIGRPEPFNVFSFMFQENEKNEVNLHSRFLRALLDYRKPGTETRENLEDFLPHVGVKDFELCGVETWREWGKIDILINNDKQAVAIENKIGAGDRNKQLRRYNKKLKECGYSDIRLLYLTLDGRAPSENSVGSLAHKCISYEEIIPWLERCQKRAYDEPKLLELIVQYLQLVRKLTGTDFRREYMDALKKLCLEENNLVLVRHLIDAMAKSIWDDIEYEIRSEDLGLPDAKVRKDGLEYKLNEATKVLLGVNNKGIWFGVYCLKEDHPEKYDKIKEALRNVDGGEQEDKEYPWWRYAGVEIKPNKITKKNINMLSDKEERKKVAKKIAEDVKELLGAIEGITW